MFSDKRQHFHFQLQSPICSYLVAQLTIVDKTQKRKPKTNLNAFKAQFLTLKKKISAITITPANFRPRKVFTPGYFNHFENEDESEKERGNHSNIDEELQNIEGRESSMEDKAEEQIEEPSSSDSEM